MSNSSTELGSTRRASTEIREVVVVPPGVQNRKERGDAYFGRHLVRNLYQYCTSILQVVRDSSRPKRKPKPENMSLEMMKSI